MAQNTQILKAKIISALEMLPQEKLELLSEFVAFLLNKSRQSPSSQDQSIPEFPVINVDDWPENLSMRREDIYDEHRVIIK